MEAGAPRREVFDDSSGPMTTEWLCHYDGTTTAWRRPDDDVPTARRRMTTAWRRHNDEDTTVRRRSDNRHKPGFGPEPGLMTCHKLGLDAEPGLMTVVAPSSPRRVFVVMSSSCRRHAIGLSSSCRRHIVVVLPSYRRQAVGTLSSCRRLHRHMDPSWFVISH